MSESLPESVRELRAQFEALVLPHRQALWKYCRMLTGSPWDGEDLFQETMLKAFASLAQLWHPMVPKAYLFRIASNAWIDQQRKNSGKWDVYGRDDAIPTEAVADPLEVEAALSQLVHTLPPKQAVVFMLMDIFGFSAAEVSGMIHLTDSSLYTSLHRARKRLASSRSSEEQASQGQQHPIPARDPHKEVVRLFVDALNRGDPSGIIRFMSDHMHNDAAPGFQEFNKEDMFTGSMQGFAEERLQASLSTLWGRQVVVVLAHTEAGWQLHDISWQAFDEDKLVLHKSYYFCRELLEEVGSLLDIPVQMQKPAVNWQTVGEKIPLGE